MNFNIHKIKLFSCLLLVMSLMACSDEFLEVTPKGNLIAQNVEDYDRLLEDLSLDEIPDTSIPLGDEVAAVDPAFSAEALRTRRLFKWEADIYNADQNPQELDAIMPIIYTYNKIINEVNDANNGTASEKLRLEAEARVGRAYCYFTLINYYGKPYNAATASSDLGFPIVVENDITATDFTRNSIQEVYDFIINDIELALPYLSESINQRNRASKAAAQALLGKIYMVQQEFELALEQYNSTMLSLENTSIPVSLYDYNIEFSDGGVFTPVNMFFGPAPVLRQNNAEVVYGKQATNGWAFVKNELVISSETANLFQASDLRLNFYSSNEFFGFFPFYPNGMLRKVGPLSQQFGVFLPDVYLSVIEAKARLGLLEEATEELVNFRAKRMPVEDSAIPTEVAVDQYELVKYIFEERIREFALSGYRWFDMRRLSVDPDYSDLVNYKHELYNPEGDVLETYTLTEDRLVLRFGDIVTSQNPNLTENP